MIRKLKFYINMSFKIIRNKTVNSEDYKKAYNKVANTYDCWIGRMGTYTDKIIYSRYLDFTKNTQILDFACGTGYITQAINNINKDCNIVAVDISEEMIKEAKKLSGENINLYNIDGIDFLKNTNRKFDIILCGWALPYFEHRELLSLFNKVLNNKGKVAIISNSVGTLNKIEEIFLKVMEENQEQVIKPMNIKQNLPNGKNELIKWFEKEGFKALEINEEEVRISFNKGAQLLDWLNKTGAIAGTEYIFGNYEGIKAKLINYMDLLKNNRGEYTINHKFVYGIFEKE